MSNVIPFPKRRPRWNSIRIGLELSAVTLYRLDKAARRQYGGSFDKAISAALDALEATNKSSPENTDPPPAV